MPQKKKALLPLSRHASENDNDKGNDKDNKNDDDTDDDNDIDNDNDSDNDYDNGNEDLLRRQRHVEKAEEKSNSAILAVVLLQRLGTTVTTCSLVGVEKIC